MQVTVPSSRPVETTPGANTSNAGACDVACSFPGTCPTAVCAGAPRNIARTTATASDFWMSIPDTFAALGADVVRIRRAVPSAADGARPVPNAIDLKDAHGAPHARGRALLLSDRGHRIEP